MILSGDNVGVFVKGDKVHIAGEYGISEHEKDDLLELRRKNIRGVRIAKEFGGRYYLCMWGRTLVAYDDMFAEPAEEIEIYEDNIFDFHIHGGRVFCLRKKTNECFCLETEQRILLDFKASTHLWDGPFFYTYYDGNLIRFDLMKEVVESIFGAININPVCLAVKDGAIAYTDNANVLHFLRGSVKLSYHYHAHAVVKMMITASMCLIMACKDGKLVKVGTRIDEKMFLSELHGEILDLVLNENYIYVLTTFSLLVYDAQTNNVRKQIFFLPTFKYYKVLSMCGRDNGLAVPGKEIFEQNVGRTKVVIPYVFRGSQKNGGCGGYIVATRKDYVFIYNLAEKDIWGVVRFRGSTCFCSSGCLTVLSNGQQEQCTVKIYEIRDEGLQFIREERVSCKIRLPKDIILEKDRVFFFYNTRVFELVASGDLRPLKNKNIKQVEETDTGFFILDACGIYKVGSEEWILEDQAISFFKISSRVLYVSTSNVGVSAFVMEDGATEEELVIAPNVTSMLVREDTMVVSWLNNKGTIFKRYERYGNKWISSGCATTFEEVNDVLYDDVYVSASNSLHDIAFDKGFDVES